MRQEVTGAWIRRKLIISLPNWLAGNQRSNSAAGPCSKPAPKDCWGCAGGPRRQLRRIHPCRRRTSVLFGRSGFTKFLQSAVDTRRETKNLACTDAVGSARYELFRHIDTARIDGLVARRPLVPNLPQTQPQRPEMEPNHAAIPSSNGPVAPRDTPTTPTCRPERAEFRSC